MRPAPLLAALLIASLGQPAPVDAAELSQLETDDLQLVWFHPTEDYLAPHVARILDPPSEHGTTHTLPESHAGVAGRFARAKRLGAGRLAATGPVPC